jgi:hypothetical protein
MKSSHNFEVFIFGKTWLKARVEEQESLYTLDGSTDYLCSASVISSQIRGQTFTSPTDFEIVNWEMNKRC